LGIAGYWTDDLSMIVYAVLLMLAAIYAKVDRLGSRR